MKKVGKILFLFSGILALASLLGEPGPLAVYGIFVVVYFLKTPLSRFVANLPWPVSFKFALLTLFFSLGFLEFLSWYGNYHKCSPNPPLLHPQLGADMILAFAFYGGWVISWLLIVRFFNFSLLEVFITQGIYGVVIEQNGAILLQGLATFPAGLILWIYVFLAYSSPLAIAYLLAENQIKKKGKSNMVIKYLIVLALLYLINMPIGFVWDKVVGSLIPPKMPICEKPLW